MVEAYYYWGRQPNLFTSNRIVKLCIETDGLTDADDYNLLRESNAGTPAYERFYLRSPQGACIDVWLLPF